MIGTIGIRITSCKVFPLSVCGPDHLSKDISYDTSTGTAYFEKQSGSSKSHNDDHIEAGPFQFQQAAQRTVIDYLLENSALLGLQHRDTIPSNGQETFCQSVQSFQSRSGRELEENCVCTDRCTSIEKLLDPNHAIEHKCLCGTGVRASGH